MRALVVGCGYAGQRLGSRLREQGVSAYGTTRRPDRAERLKARGIEPVVGGLTDRGTLRRVDRLGVEVVFYLVPPVRTGADPLTDVLEATSRSPLEAFVYASSTSVYGDRDGGWVDETTPVRPVGESARARQGAERAVLEAGWRYQTPTRICRIAGIYGPGRTLRDSLERGDYLLIRGHDTWVNRVHVEDLVSALIAVWRAGGAGRVYNISDGSPHRSSEFADLAAELHGLPLPEWVSLEEARDRYGEKRLRRKLANKRVSNRRLREELEWTPRYPSFRVGLPAAITEERQATSR